MEVMNLVDFKQLQQKINDLSKEYFSYSTSMKDQDVPLYKPANRLLHTRQERTANHAPPSKNKSHFLIVWGCGEFGQHGSGQSGDVTFEMAIRNFKSNELMLPDCECPVSTVCGSSHTLLLTGTDKVYSWGNGISGQLGNGTCLATTKPRLVPLSLDNKIQGMSCGARHSFIWTTNGYCYSFGNNFNAQLGYNFSKADFKENQLWPVLVELFPDMKVKKVSCGARHSLFLLTTGRVMAVGCNQHGQIGNDTTEDVVIPTMLDDLHSITHIACGNIHSLASHENGSLYAWGYGKAFGIKTRHVATPHVFAPKDIESAVISLAGGDCHSMVLYDSGVLLTWGNNYEGQLGLGKDVKYQNEPEAIPSNLLPRPVVQIACGESTSAAVTGKGELFMWGKNAGLIHSEKSSQYFQYTPHHIEMEGMSVAQISCGAWHVSAIIKNSANETEEISQNLESEESFESEESHKFTNQKADLVKNAGLPCENRDPDNSNEQQRRPKCSVKSMDTNTSDRSVNACFRTKYNSQTEISRVNIIDDDAQLSEHSLDTCFITKYGLDPEFSIVENECCENGILATDKQLTKYSQKVDSEQKQGDRLAIKTAFHGADKIGCRTNETRDTNVVDSLFGYKEEECCVARQHENRLQLDEACNMEKQNDLSKTAEQMVGDYPEEEFTTTYAEKEPSLRYSSGYKEGIKRERYEEEEERYKGNTRKSLVGNESAATYSTFESENVCGKEFETDILENNDKKKNNDNLPNDTFRNDNFVKDNHLQRDDGHEDTRNSLASYDENISWDKNSSNNNYFRCNTDAVNMDIIENNKGSQIGRKNHRLNHWDNFKSRQADKKSGPFVEKSICEDISGLSLDSFEENPVKESSVVKRNIRLAITPLNNGNIKHNSILKRNTEVKLVRTPAQNKTMEQKTTGSKLAITSTQNKNMNYDKEVFTQQHIVPVIDLSFGRAVRHTEQSRIKPSFTAFKNVWKASNLFREKQKQKRIGIASRRGSDGIFTLESMLPNRPVHAVKEIEKWSKFKEDFTQYDSTQELKRTTDKSSKCCHDTGEVLPPICSCKNEVVLKRGGTFTNVFLDRR